MTQPVSLDHARHTVASMRLTADGPDAYFAGLLGVMSAHGTRFVGACWHLTDPATGAFTWASASGEMPGDFASAIENEYLEDDVAKYSELAHRGQAVATLVEETGGRPRRSLRYRRSFEPEGFADELRAVFADPFGRWGSIALVSDSPFTRRDSVAAAALAPIVARCLREEVARTAPQSAGTPGMLVLDRDDRVRSRDRRASELLAGPATTGTLPAPCTCWRPVHARATPPSPVACWLAAAGSRSTRARWSTSRGRSRSCFVPPQPRPCSTCACGRPASGARARDRLRRHAW